MGIVIVNYGSHGLIEESLAKLGAPPDWLSIIIVDNFRTTDDSRAMERLALEHHWNLIGNQRNLGFGVATNQGLELGLRLGCEAFLMLNPDARVSMQCLEELRDAALANPLALISPAIVRPDGSPWFTIGLVSPDEGGLRRWSEKPPHGSSEWLSGACLAAHRDIITRLGGFDRDYFLYWEDVDLSYRCSAAGGSIIVRRDLVVVHDVGGTQTGPNVKSPTYYYYNTRNRLVFAKKNLRRGHQVAWVIKSPTDIRRLLSRGGRSQYKRPLRVFPPVIAGFLAGLWWMIHPRVAPSRPGKLLPGVIRTWPASGYQFHGEHPERAMGEAS